MFNIQLDQLEKIIADNRTPLFIYNLNTLKNNSNNFKQLFPNFSIYYSVKTNPLKEILKALGKDGVNFDVASVGEISLIKKSGFDGSRGFFTHPIKTPEIVKRAVNSDVNFFAFDTLEELALLRRYAPGKKYLLRIKPPSDGDFYKYSDKFGASKKDIIKILDFAYNKAIEIQGMCFHVGSQNMKLQPWKDALRFCRKIIDRYYNKLPNLRIMNIGSGFPYKYSFRSCITLKDVASAIQFEIKKFPEDFSFWAEPGRILVANTGILVCSVLRNIQRTENRWLYIDMSVYHGLIEILESGAKLTYPISWIGKKSKNLVTYNVSGNTLDPDDTVAFNVNLPEDIQMGDKIILEDIGAYTSSFHCHYHELPKPKFFFI